MENLRPWDLALLAGHTHCGQYIEHILSTKKSARKPVGAIGGVELLIAAEIDSAGAEAGGAGAGREDVDR